VEKNYITGYKNPFTVALKEIPILKEVDFFDVADRLLDDPSNHCITYFVIPADGKYRFTCCIAMDAIHEVAVFSMEKQAAERVEVKSLTAKHLGIHIFERDIFEQYGIGFRGHPWLKPVVKQGGYPFYTIAGEGIHEVGVGPVHAGIIEPGYFRFICNGENVLHLEIQLGYQHRGVEKLMVEKEGLLSRSLLSESIAGDTAVGHSLAFTGLVESLSGKEVPARLAMERTIALELERIAVHIGDTAALCTDIGYQLGQVVNEALRTIVINTTQAWCGNRFGKGLVRPGGSNYPLTSATTALIRANLVEVLERYLQMTAKMFTMPSVLSRFENTGRITTKQAAMIGAVGMAARSAGLVRDIRQSHPLHHHSPFTPVHLYKGDVWARAMQRKKEVEQSVEMIFTTLDILEKDQTCYIPSYDLNLQPNSLSVSLVEGWRGEICHAAVTDRQGNIESYKVTDPSRHNWLALALAVRGQEISDFPLCNKSFNLSYCGHDL
jgi:Ni,Fe-hydrogenase III large subunit